MELEVSQSDNDLWGDWVDGKIPGWEQDDDGPLFDAQEEAERRIRARYGA